MTSTKTDLKGEYLTNSDNHNLEHKLWIAADKLRSNMDAAEYKHVVLGLIFLKYISDAFNEVHKELTKDPLSDPEDKDEYLARLIFWVPKVARWEYLAKNAKMSEIGQLVDNAMIAIEKDNPSLKGVLFSNYARPSLNKQRLGELIDLIGTIGLGDKENRSKDILGNVYEYFLGQFADAEGKKGGQFYTPRSIVKLLVEMLQPFKGRIFDPCCGSGGMFIQSEKFVEAHGGRIKDISIYGQESNQTTWRLCKMNLAIRGIDSKIEWGDSFRDDRFKDLKADFILANPPFNDSDWGGEFLQNDVRWKDFAVPPSNNANFAWVLNFMHHLSPSGTAGFVLANGSMSSNNSGEGEIRKKIIDDGLLECMVALPSQLFYNTMIPACLWFISRNKKILKFKGKEQHVLFIDARKLGTMIDRRHRELTDEDIKKISETYHNWKEQYEKYQDIPGFCKSVSLNEIRMQEWILTPGRYVGMEEEIEEEKLAEKMNILVSQLKEHMKTGKKLEDEVRRNLEAIGYEM